MRWTDNSMGSNFDYGWSDINQAFAAGTSACTSAARTSTPTSSRRATIDPSIYGLAPIPLAKNKTAGVLGGGTLAAVQAGRERAARAAAREVDRLLLRAAADQEGAGDPQRQDARCRASSRSASRRCRSSTRRSTTSRTPGSSPTSTFLRSQMKPFTTGIFDQKRDPRAGRFDAERLPLARRPRRGGPDRQERRISTQLLNEANALPRP